MTDEWGIPDWQTGDYGETSRWNLNRWRWEFLRRRDDLREEFDRKAEARFQKNVARYAQNPEAFGGQPPRSPSQPGFHLYTTKIAYDGSSQPLPNPRIGDQPYYAISWTDGAAVWREFGSERPPAGFLRFDFDLSKPIDSQLDCAKQALKEFQVLEHGRLIQKRRHPTKWSTYLRILDGRAAGASWSQLTAILPSRNGTEQAARDAWQQADALRFNF